jgi:transposase-like protein
MCPGYTGRKKQRKMAWDDDKKAKAVAMYKAADVTPENSMEIVKEIADELGESANGVRAILSKAEVYVKKTPAGGSSAKPAGDKPAGGARVSKEAAHAKLTAAINTIGAEVNDEVISKLTGKAALYFAEVLASATKD